MKLTSHGISDFLRSIGARCEAGTFDGERCMYAALTREIKVLLKQSHILVHRTDPFV